MHAVDTNVLVRLLARDDLRQTEAAERNIAGGAWVSLLVLAETFWVLAAMYGFSRPQIAEAAAMLLKHDSLAMQDPEVIEAALGSWRLRPALTLTDCLILEVARRHAHLPLATFDRQLARLDGASHIG